MLDNETKRRIDTARDILVGKVPDPKSQVEQITIAMIYKFMDDMDKEALNYGGQRSFFMGDYEKYAWTNLFDPRLGGHEVLNLYGEALVKLPLNTNPDFPQLFRDIFKNAYLPYRDPETLKLFIKTINEFSYDHSEKLGDAFEYLLSIMGSQGDAGQFRTPRNIIDFVVEILQPKKHETMLDPACGTAGFLISAFKHILKANTSLNNAKEGNLLTPDERTRLTKNIRGYDISPDMVRLSLVNLYLHGFTNPEIYEYDSLSTEDRWNEYYDVILANPPFMTPKGGIKPHKRFSIQSNRAEVLFVDFIAEHLTPTGRAGIIVPEGIIFQSGTAYKSLRKMLIDKYLWAVVSLPAGIFNPYSGVKTSILLLDKTLSKKTDNILFVKVQEDGFGLGAQRRANDKNDLPTALNLLKKYQTSLKEQQTTPFGDAVHDDMALVISKAKIIENGDYNFSGDRYKVSDDLRFSSYEMVELGKICIKVTDGSHFSPETINEGYPYITVRDIQEDTLDLQNCKFVSSENYNLLVKNGCKPQINDILFSKDGTVGKVYLIKENTDFVVLSSLAIITPNCKMVLPEYLKYLLKSDVFLDIAISNKTGVAIKRIVLKTLKTIQIPLPPLAIQKQIVDEIEGYQQVIDGAKQVIKAYKPHISIKKHWEMVELGKIFKLSSGQALTQRNIIEGNCPVYGGNGINGFHNKYFLENPTIVIGRVGEYCGAVHMTKPKSWVTDNGLYVVNYYQEINSNYLALILHQANINQFAKVGGQPSISQSTVYEIKIPVPPLSEQEEIVSAIEKEQQLVNANKELVVIMEAKIKAKIAEVWGEEKEVKKEKKYHVVDEPLAMVAEV